MTAKELINILQELPGDTIIVKAHDEFCGYYELEKDLQKKTKLAKVKSNHFTEMPYQDIEDVDEDEIIEITDAYII